MLNHTQMPSEILAKFVVRFKTVSAVDNKYSLPQAISPEMVAESLINWFMLSPPKYASTMVWDRVMQDRLYYKMGEVYIDAEPSKSENRRYSAAKKKFIRDIISFMTAEMDWEAPE